jgi:hypothetical protein
VPNKGVFTRCRVGAGCNVAAEDFVTDTVKTRMPAKVRGSCKASGASLTFVVRCMCFFVLTVLVNCIRPGLDLGH